MTEEKPLKIVSLQAENVKRLVAVRIDPTGNLVEITGKNGAGKTSVLDSIWWALAGAGVVQKSPIRRGEQRALVKLDLGELIVTRTFTRVDGEEFVTSVSAKTADGVKVGSPQKVLDAMVGAIALDPFEFARMPAKEQFDTLRGFVSGYDFAAAEEENKKDRDRRTDVNRRAREAATRAAAIPIPASTPAERVDESAITDELAAVGDHNARIALRADRRTAAAKEANDLRASAALDKERAEALLKSAAEKVGKADELEKRLAEAPELEAPKDAAEVRARLEAAKRTNAAVDAATRRKELQDEAAKLEAEADAITARMKEREESKRQAIAAAALPVPGLGFGDQSITLNGVPFEQASDAERLRTSCAIAMASNPRLRVIRVRDGSLLDEDGLRLLAEMADKADCQVWVERVDSSGRVGFVIEDGQVRHVPDAPAKAAD